jgi:hypothetical protein
MNYINLFTNECTGRKQYDYVYKLKQVKSKIKIRTSICFLIECMLCVTYVTYVHDLCTIHKRFSATSLMWLVGFQEVKAHGSSRHSAL